MLPIIVIFVLTILAPEHANSSVLTISSDQMVSEEPDEDMLEQIQGTFQLTDQQMRERDWKLDETEGMQLEKGSYRIQFQYSGTGQWSVYQIYSETEMNGEGSPFVLYASGILSQQSEKSGNCEVTLELPQETTNVQIRMIYPADQLENREISIDFGTDLDRWGYFLFLACIWLVLWYLTIVRYREDRKSRAIVWMLALAAFWLCLPFCNDFLLQGGDTGFHLGRIEGIYEALRDGQIPMWINMHQCSTYGYATPIMYPQLFFYLPALFRLAGMSLLGACKIFYCLINIFTVVIAYLSFRRIFCRRGISLAAALFYSFSTYYFIDLYLRAAIGETLAMMFAPFLAAALYEIILGNERMWPLFVVAVTGILESHVLSTYMYGLLAAVTLICGIPAMHRSHPGRRILALCKGILFSLLINMFFIIPFLSYYQENFKAHTGNFQTIVGRFLNQAAYLSQLFNSFVIGEGGSKNLGTTDEMPITVGVLSLVVLILSTGVLIAGRNEWKRSEHSKRYWKLGIYALVGTLLLLYLSSDCCPWNVLSRVPVLRTLVSMQFPWRLLGPATLLLSILEGCLLYFLAAMTEEPSPVFVMQMNGVQCRVGAHLILFAIAGIAIVLNSFFLIQSVITKGTLQNKGEAMIQSTNYIDDLYLYQNASYYQFNSRGNIVTARDEGTKIYGLTKDQTFLTFSYQLPEGCTSTELTIPLNYYPGYRAYVNNQEVPITYDDGHLITVTVSGEVGELAIIFSTPVLWKIAYVISAAGVFLMILLSGMEKLGRTQKCKVKKEHTIASRPDRKA